MLEGLELRIACLKFSCALDSMVATKRVPISEMVPGDLVFYSYKGTVSTIHHIAIYAGDGMMWEAHNKDKDLLFSSIYSIKGLMPYGGRV